MGTKKVSFGTLAAGLGVLGLGFLGGLTVETMGRLVLSPSAEIQHQSTQRGAIKLVAVASPRLIDSLVKLAGFQRNDLIEEKVLCNGIQVDDKKIIVPRRCILHADLLGRPTKVQVQGPQGASVPIGEILAIDQSMDLALLAIEPQWKSDPIEIRRGADLNSTPLFLEANTLRVGDENTIVPLGSPSAQMQFMGHSDAKTFKVTGFSGVHVPGILLRDTQGRLLGLSSGGKTQVGNSPIFAISADSIGQWLDTLATLNQPSAPRQTVELLASQSPDFKPLRLLQSLGLTVQESSIPYFKRELEGIKVKVDFPIKPDEFDRAMVSQVSEQVEASFVKLQSQNEPRSVPMLTWGKLVFDKNKDFFANHRSLKQRTHYSYDGGKTLSPNLVIVTPPLSWTYEPQLIPTQSFHLNPNQRPRLPGDSGDLEEDRTPGLDQVRSSEPPLQPRLLAKFFYKPLITVRLRPTEQRGPNRPLMQRELFEGIAGDAGLMVYGDFRFLNPDRQREVVLQNLDEPLQNAQVKDSLGRAWQYYGFELLDTYAVDTWCGALPGGQLCVTKSFPLTNSEAHKAFAYFSQKYSLSQYLVEPEFWPIHALSQYQSAGHLQEDPLIGDFSLDTSTSKEVSVSYQERGIKVTHVGLDDSTQVRFIGAAFQKPSQMVASSTGSWQALAHEVYDPRGDNSRLCQVGLVTPQTQVPKEALIQPIFAKGSQEKVYSYCIPVDLTNGHPALVRTVALKAKAQPYAVKVSAF
jgi:hypothetical protein